MTAHFSTDSQEAAGEPKMNRRLSKLAPVILFLAITRCATAQTTTITATITDPMGDPISGSCSVQGVGGFTAATGWRVIGAPTAVRFSSGAFSVSLAPTDSASPSSLAVQYYRVTCAVPLQIVSGHTIQPYSWGPRYWSVPTSFVSVDIGAIEMTSPPPQPAPIIPLTTQPQDGQYIKWSAALAAWQPVTFADQETPGGTIDGVNATFTLAASPTPAAGLLLFRNGLAQKSCQDYSLAGNVVTFLTGAIPAPGDTLLASYRY
jgi:hypothetical protein